jgi:hypothetical protein
MPSAKRFYLVTASKCDYDEYDSIVVVAYSESQAVRLALEEGGPATDDLHYPHFDESQGPFSAEYFNPFKYKTGDKPIASFHAG